MSANTQEGLDIGTGSCSWCGTPLTEDALCQQCYDAWPKCAIGPCQNKACIRLHSRYCWPHTPGVLSERDKAAIMEDREPVTEPA